ncbi:MAG: sigma-54 dependent transcriptional regulator [Bacteroidota bacterium]
MKSKLLIVEDQFIEANNLKIILKKAGYAVCTIARSVPEAIQIVDREKPDMVLLDIFLDGPETGIDLAHTLNKRNIAFVFLSANSNKQTLNAAKATNPYGFLVKPFRERDVLVMLDVALYRHDHNQKEDNGVAKKELKQEQDDAFKMIKGASKKLMAVLDEVAVVGKSDVSVLILGESGTGKELVAKAVHQISNRRSKPLVVVNCAALPANLIESELFGHEKGSFTGASEKRIGKFEQADGGTVFLDEIGELPLDLQVKFLRVLQEKEIEPIGGKKKAVNVRVIAATNRNLIDEMASGRFRMDLYYRLNVFPITLPPLRERKEDIVLLAEHFLKLFSLKEQKQITGFSDHALNALVNYSWPGNIRELENIIERSVLLASGRLITSVSVPVESKPAVSDTFAKVKTMTENERDHILAALEICNWKIYGEGGAAEMLDMNGNTLHSRMKKLGIEKHISSKK